MDTIPYLFSRNEMPCVIQGNEEEEEIHFVIHQKQLRTLHKHTNLYNRSIYIKIGNSEIRCTISEIKKAHVEE